MELGIRFRGGDRAGELLRFPGDTRVVRLGRDPACDVRFPAWETSVARRHCSLLREGTVWKLVVEPGCRVRADGRVVLAELKIVRAVELQLGPNGPVVRIEPGPAVDFPTTDDQAATTGTHTLVERLRKQLDKTRAVVLTLFVLLVGVAAIAFWTGSSNEHEQVVAAVKNAKGSVYVLLVRERDGPVRAHATAWVVATDRLATNAHVGKEVERTQQRGAAVIARSPRGTDFEVVGVTMHPEFEPFARLVRELNPAFLGAQGVQEFEYNVPVCDVALLHVQAGSKLDPPLPIASLETVGLLSAGDVVGAPVHPIAARSAGGSPEWLAVKPEPQAQIGNVTAVTDFLLLQSDTDRSVVHHNIPTSPGSSGTPILNSRGEVVAIHSAGETIRVQPETGGPPRIVSTGAGIGYAQSAEFLRELLPPGVALAPNEERQRGWLETLQGFRTYSEELVAFQENVRQERLERWQQSDFSEFARLDLEVAEWPSATHAKAKEDGAVPPAATTELAPGSYLILVLPQHKGNYLLSVRDVEGEAAPNYGSGWYPEVTLQLEAKRRVQIRVEGDRATRAVVELFRAFP